MSLILAKIFGLYGVSIGIALLLKPDRFKILFKQTMKDDSFLLLGGIMALLIGAVIVSLHNEWVMGWPLIITILGWWSFIKGFALLVYPESAERYFSFILNQPAKVFQYAGIFWVALGLFLIYHS